MLKWSHDNDDINNVSKVVLLNDLFTSTSYVIFNSPLQLLKIMHVIESSVSLTI
jgi:hypothetical protein